MLSSKIVNCESVKSELSSYIDGELDNEIKKSVEEHLKTCEDCRREYRKLLKIKKEIKGLKKIEVDADLPLKIIQSISESKPLPVIAWFPVTIRVALLLAILINITILSLFRDYRQRIPKVSSYRTVKVENILPMEEKSGVSVNFAFPFEDSTEKYKPPLVVSMKQPTYSEKLFSKKIEGTVILNIVVDKIGKVRNVKVKKSLSPEADSLSISSAKTMRFQPAKIGTLNVETNVTATFLFKI